MWPEIEPDEVCERCGAPAVVDASEDEHLCAACHDREREQQERDQRLDDPRRGLARELNRRQS